MHAFNKPFDPSAGISLTLPFPNTLFPLSISTKYNESQNVPILHRTSPRHPWRKQITMEFLRNSWVLVIDGEQPIAAKGSQDTLAFLKPKDSA